MPATYEWFNEDKTLMYEKFSGDWTWHDFIECIKGASEQIRTVDHPVVAIADYTESKTLPMSGASLKIARDVMNNAPENWMGVVIISENRLIRAMVSLFQSANRTFGDKVYLETTLEDAIRRAETIGVV